MANERKWVLYNTLTGSVIQDIPFVEDTVYRDINNGDEATISIPAYALSDSDRLDWSTVFRPWARGIALIDMTNNVWNAANKIIFAGPIVKPGFVTEEEEIRLTAFNFFEHLKKNPVLQAWETVTDATAHEVIESGSWASLYSKLIQRMAASTAAPTTSATAPSGYNPIHLAQMRNYQAISGTGKSVNLKVIEGRTPAGVMEEIRDSISEKGNEFQFVPFFTDSSMNVIKFDLITGTDTAPHINESNVLNVPLYEENSHNWQVVEWTVDGDGTMMYNKIAINGSTDAVVGNFGQANDFSTTYPAMTETFDAGTTLTAPQMTDQLTARMIGSLVAEKTATLTITNDTGFEWISNLGRTLNLMPGDKSAGSGAVLRCVGIRMSNSADEESAMRVEIDVVRLAARYPKLPIDVERETTEPLPPYGGGNSDWTSGGEIPEIPDFGMDDGTPSGTLGFTNVMPSPQPITYGWDLHYSNVWLSKFYYGIRRFTYVRTSTLSQFTNVLIRCYTPTIDSTTYANPHVSANAYTDYDLTSFLNTNFVAPPYSITNTNGGTAVSTYSNSQNFVMGYLLAIKGKLYVLITVYDSYYRGAYVHGYDGGQILVALDINSTTGALSNPQVVTGGFKTDLSNHTGITIAPRQTGTTNTNGLSAMLPPPIVLDENTAIFTDVDIFKKLLPYSDPNTSSNNVWDYRIYDDSMDDIIFQGLHSPLVMGDFTSPMLPTFRVSARVPNQIIQSDLPSANTSGQQHMTKNGLKVVTEQQRSFVPGLFYQSMVNDTVNQTLWATLRQGTEAQIETYYPETKPPGWNDTYISWRGVTQENNVFRPLTKSVVFKKNYQVYRLRYGAGETKWTKFGPNFRDKIIDDVYTQYSNGTNTHSLFPLPDGSGVFIPLPRNSGSYPTMRGWGIFISETSIRRNNVGGQRISLQSFTGNTDDRNALDMNNAWRHRVPQQVLANLWIVNSTRVDTGGSADRDGNSGFRYQLSFMDSPFSKKFRKAHGKSIITGDGDLYEYSTPLGKKAFNTRFAQKANNNVWLSASSNNNFSLAVDTNKKLWGWGTSAALFGGTFSVPTQIGTDNWKQVFVGSEFAILIGDDDRLYTFGTNANGRTGQGTTSGTTATPTLVAGATTKPIKVAVCDTAWGYIDESRDLWRVGNITSIFINTTPFKVVIGSEKWLGLAFHRVGMAAVSYLDGGLWTLGINNVVGGGSSGTSTSLTKRTGAGAVVAVEGTTNTTSGYESFVALKSTGEIVGVGTANAGMPTNTFSVVYTPHPVEEIYSGTFSVYMKLDKDYVTQRSLTVGADGSASPTNSLDTTPGNVVPVFGIYPIGSNSSEGDGGMIGA